jgi:DNA-binding NarL/FixJ family response regulator
MAWTEATLMSIIRLLLVDDHEVIIDGVRAMLRNHADEVEVSAAVKTVPEAMQILAQQSLDLILTDARLKTGSGFELLEQVVGAGIETPVVFYTAYDDEAYLFRALRGGARGYILKQATSTELVGLLTRVMEGEITIDPSIAGRVALLAARLQLGEFWPGAHLGLTHRESEILELIVKGMSTKSIAQNLFLGEETVKSHLSSIYRKLKVKSRAEAVAVALRDVTFR